MENDLIYTPTDFLALVNQTLEYAYSSVIITGEVSSFKVNQGKWVFFDLKDEESSVSCFMSVWSLRQPLEDGMKVKVRGVPKITKWGKFSFTVTQVQPVGEGSLKKAFEILKKKLEAEGLFDPAKKRMIPKDLTRLGVISSTQAAGYADFVKIVNARWGGMKILTAHTQVQGLDAPDQIIKALSYFNERGNVQMIAILRGGGSADDLSCFNDEALARAVAASKIPVITGIGHEVDETLVDLVADVRASTPSNAAEMLTPDREMVKKKVYDSVLMAGRTVYRSILSHEEDNHRKILGVISKMRQSISMLKDIQNDKILQMSDKIQRKITEIEQKYNSCLRVLEVVNPEKVLKQGYAILTGKMSPGDVVKITTYKAEIEAEIKKIKERK